MSKKELTYQEQQVKTVLENIAAGFEGSAAVVTLKQRHHQFLVANSTKKTDLRKCEQAKSGGYLVPAPLLCEAVASIGSEQKTTKGSQ